MQDALDALPVDARAPRTHLLGASPPMVGLRQLGYEFVGRRLTAGDQGLVVTTDQGAGAVTDAIRDHVDTDDLERLGIIDATGQDPPPDLVARVESVGSPADLTGIGIGLTKLREAGNDDPGVLVDSVSSLLVYSGFDRVYEFLHAITNRIGAAGGSSLCLLSSDTNEQGLSRLESLFDGVLEARTGEAGPEYRLRGRDGSGEWLPLGTAGEAQPPVEHPAGADREDSTAALLEPPGSLQEAIESVQAAGLTLTLVNRSEGAEWVADLETYLGRQNVAVREAELSTATPKNAAILHRGADVIATSAIADIHAAISLEALESPDPADVTRPDVLADVHRNEYAVADGSKLDLVRISRLIESRALEAGFGTLHGGFQVLERIEDDLQTRDLYERIARRGVTVHIYGRPGPVPNEELYTLHPAEDRELAESWFVVFDGGGADRWKAALVCEETAPGRYTGFWTYQPPLVDEIAAYLDRVYGT